MLILDEPTNHLDVDAREALVQALNAYTGAVILISHDRHMVETTADRLVLVDHGTARDYDGSIEDYIDYVLGRNQPKDDKAKSGKGKGKSTPADREAARELKTRLNAAERELAKLQQQLGTLDTALASPASRKGDLKGLTMEELAQCRASISEHVENAELLWLDLGEQVEALA